MKSTIHELKILFITSDKYPPFRPAAKAIFGEELVKRGFAVDWILQAERSCRKHFETPLGNGHAYIGATDDGQSIFSRIRKHMLDLINDLRMFSLNTNNNYDLIQVKDKYLSALAAIILAKRNNIRFTYWLAYPHAEASLYSAKQRTARYRLLTLLRGVLFKFLLYKFILPAAHHIFVQSEQMRKDFEKEGIPLEKMTAVPGSLNLKDIPYDAHSEVGMDIKFRQEKQIAYLGTLMRVRRLDFLIRVFARVVHNHPEAKLYLIGKGEMAEDETLLHAEVNRLGLEQSVIFTGFLPMVEAWEYIRRANVCVSPYYPTPILNSTSPTKLIEYMAMGKAVVGNDHPEQSLVITESGAGICVPWEEEKFAQAIIDILNDPMMAQEMGHRGRRYVEIYRTNNVIADRVALEYLRLCNVREENVVLKDDPRETNMQ